MSAAQMDTPTPTEATFPVTFSSPGGGLSNSSQQSAGAAGATGAAGAAGSGPAAAAASRSSSLQRPSRLPSPQQSSRAPPAGQILSERFVEHTVRVPRKIVRESIVEKVIVVPEKVLHEEVVEEIQTVREKIVEVAKPIIQERIVQVPEIEYIERIVEVPEVIVQEKIREIPRLEIQERIIEVPKIIVQERTIEVPEVLYEEVPFETVVEIPQIYEKVVVKPVLVPQYVDRPIAEFVDVEDTIEVVRHVPVPVECTTTLDFIMPRIRPRYTQHDVPLYVPRFIEVPLPVELLDPADAAEAARYAEQVAVLAAQSAPSLCEVERLAGILKGLDGYYDDLMLQAANSTVQRLTAAWRNGSLDVAAEGAWDTEGKIAPDRLLNGPVAASLIRKAVLPTVVHGGYTLRGKAIHQGTVCHPPAYGGRASLASQQPVGTSMA